MTITISRSTVLTALALAATVVSASALIAQGPDYKAKAKAKAKEVIIQGRIVDLHHFMTAGYASADRGRTTREALQSGIPALLETHDGPVLLGMGKRAENKNSVMALAYEEAEMKGMLFEMKGLRYLDIASVTPLKAAMPEKEEGEEYQDEDMDTDPHDQDEDED